MSWRNPRIASIVPCGHEPKAARGACINCYQRQRYAIQRGPKLCHKCGLVIVWCTKHQELHPWCRATPKPLKGRKLADPTRILAALFLGKSNAQIVAEEHCSMATITKVAHANGIRRRGAMR